jgi:hypothetical protein
MKTEDKILATHWVLAHGVDCDGYNSGNVTAFANKKDAEQYLYAVVEGSDGLQYDLTDDWTEVEEYCYSYGKKSINYKTI